MNHSLLFSIIVRGCIGFLSGALVFCLTAQPWAEPEPVFAVDKLSTITESTTSTRQSDWVEYYHMSIKTLAERPDQPPGEIVYLIKDVFTTRNGSWEPTTEPGAIPQWAREDYLQPNFLEANSDHHLFALVLDQNGQPLVNHQIRYWSDGFEKLGDPNYNNYAVEQTKESSSWANYVMWGGSVFYPNANQSGPWCWTPVGPAEVMCGGGLPDHESISTFVVWQAVNRNQDEASATATVTATPTAAKPTETAPAPTPLPDNEEADPAFGSTPTSQGESTATPSPTSTIAATPQPTALPTIERRMGSWVSYLRLNDKSLAENPKQHEGDVVYILKDLFTTRNGSWEPSAEVGAIQPADIWAREAYLKPSGAPDYFDDAGGDTHLFAAVIGLDGKLQGGVEIAYWSDGFAKLNDPTYTDYTYRPTKTGSGWANIAITGGSSYVPERQESGPWCWGPQGATEIICGGGLPANQHVSTFAVWQAVPRASLVPTPSLEGLNNHVYLPFVGRDIAE